MSMFLVFGLGFAVNIFLPWWAVVILSFFVAGILNRYKILAFIAAFVGAFLLWAGHAFILDGDALLSSRLAEIFSMPTGPAMFALTGLVAALPSGFAGVAGSFLFDLFFQKRAVEIEEEARIEEDA